MVSLGLHTNSQTRRLSTISIGLISILCWVLGSPYRSSATGPQASTISTPWTELADGLELAEYHINKEILIGDSIIKILRADPEKWEFQVLFADTGNYMGMSARDWGVKHNLTAVINAGMFHPDRSHVGYLKSNGHIINNKVNKYMSAAAYDPEDSDLPPFHIFDLDEVDIDSITAQYRTVIQNLRLIKHPGENRWVQQPKKWSEAALGEDTRGRILFIFCRSPFSMHDLNEILLALSIELVAAQHLEGGPEAQLFINSGGREIKSFGSYETNFKEDDNNCIGWPIPYVIGLTKRITKE